MYLYIQDDELTASIIDLSVVRTIKASGNHLYFLYKNDEDYDKLYFRNNGDLQKHVVKIHDALITNNSLKIKPNKELLS